LTPPNDPRAAAQLNGDAITDWNTFHSECAVTFGFPDFYGRNLNAWIDCLTYVRDGDGMSRFVLKQEEVLRIELLHSQSLRERLPEIFAALSGCVRDVNKRSTDAGETPCLELVLL
jgi:hypothetical protein